MPDSLSHIIDTLSILKPDTLLLNDSLLRADSLAVVDSLKLAIPATPPSGLEGVLSPSTPGSEPWVFIVLLGLFFLLAIGLIQSGKSFMQIFKSYFSRKAMENQLIYPVTNIAHSQWLITVFAICVFALLTYEITFLLPGKFQLLKFGTYCVIFAGFYILKLLLFEMVGNTFFDKKTTKNYKNLYTGIVNILAVLLYPILILYTYQPESWRTPLLISALMLSALFYIMLIVKLFQIFYSKPLALFYIFLYLCTLEILPILLLIRACEKFV